MSTPQKVEKVSKAKGRLILEHPFFASLLLRTDVVMTEQFPYAATDGTKIYVNPKFAEDCSVDDLMSVLAHEVGHDSLLHSLRMDGRNHTLWNIAGDHAINLMLEEQGFKAPKALPGGWLADPKYDGWSADRIYADLQRNPPPSPPSGSGGNGPPSSSGSEGGEDKGDSSQPDHDPGLGHERDILHGDLLPTPAKTEAEKAEAEQRTRQRVAAAATMARMQGKLSGRLARMVDDMLETKVSWTDVLADFLLKVVKAREVWTRRNRRFPNIILPSRHEKRMGPIVFIPDTSGSMWGPGGDIQRVVSEMAHCAAQTRPEHIRVVWADTEVEEEVYEPDEFSFDVLEPKGCGGTDMRVPLKHVEQYEPQAVVLMTDGYTPWPDAEPPYPLIVLCTTDAPVPIGRVVRV